MIINSNHYISTQKALLFLPVFIFTGLITNSINGQPINNSILRDTIINKAWSPDIHTVLLRSATWELSDPVIESGSMQQLELRFDDLSCKSRSFGYTLIHCDANWKRSDLSQQEYLSGFGQGQIRETTNSFNTTTDYINYRLVFPEEDCNPLLSGNYAVVVYDGDDPEKIIITRRFYIAEKSVQIEGKVKQPPPGEFRETGQQVEFSVLYNESNIRDPLSDISAVIKQNDRDDNEIVLSKPFSVKPGRLEYSDPDAGIFQGGNEFRSLDIKSLKYQTENMAAIDFEYPGYHFYMKPDEDRSYNPYFSKADLNGNYYIDSEKSDDKHSGSDYVNVHFRFSLPISYSTDNVFVTGGFRDWAMDETNKMTYNAVNTRFEITLLLKQGLYDYCFATTDPQTGKLNETGFEGSYYESKNEYAVFIYFHDRHGRYDRLVGWSIVK